ncbi:hypothetical protein CH255_09680 [Rhodococcus sp. 05-2255-2A2]|uniref:M23 family metallopeptidase n=1 Tax=unclassified Rhodococcus (in: high G+C Gram-positive bacteria) TaxID=192944 RepID=UPI000B9AB31B|nr:MULTISPECIES: M23 family metallopeptidase [unclassified Rhodococcus (in: high G+C Gram-positive bacteria)]OZE11903.1 hypothetical protein CH250_09410 [Rhodococcus sp. 05-2255-3C]OZE20505.1 hypothetical protein CH255_09680 [Rhodococcus sp. 05-2255-2A2]
MTRYFPMEPGFRTYSGFGYRSNPYPGWHWGVDFGRQGGSGGNPVFACAAGRVVSAGPASGFGQWVRIDHPAEAGGGFTVYGHVLPECRVGDVVQGGQRIARINPDGGPRGSNGGVDPHLHLECYERTWVQANGGSRPGCVDPIRWLGDGLSPGETPPDDSAQWDDILEQFLGPR